ncbi:SGNH hydrolase domain-containing protein [Microbacterium abyssi]|uniref:SGNH hydrolase domain-containing protein n=1 Tax=Microbacterium abyssi TaxID=2782166 RepID=UPI001889BF04|nr:SGNH hydrolase domain-containing protein [Microbacterium sp. A18JL241]
MLGMASRSRMPRAHRAVFRADVQGLRMVAVVAVILDHLLHWPAGGFVGVDIFFVISGFLITGLLLREHERTGTISFSGFYRRRIKRILPAATLVVILTVAASYLLLSRVRATDTFWDGVWASLFSANWNYAAEGTDYFQPDVAVSPLQHYWSLSVEEQFYFVWPWLMLLILWLGAKARAGSSSRSSVSVQLAIIAIIVGSFVWSMWETAASPTWAYFSTFSRAWELGIGAAIAVFAKSCARIPDEWRPALGWLGLVGIGISLFVVTPERTFPAPWGLLPVLATALVIIAGTGGEQRFLWPLTNRVSTYVGDVSYSLYLWHWPVIVLMSTYLPLDTVPNQAIAIAVIIGCSIGSYHLVENPIRNSSWLDGRVKATFRNPRGWRHRGPVPKLVALSLTSVVTVGTVAWALIPQEPRTPISPPEVVFLGDSYTAGIGSDGPDWPTSVSEELGWNAVNLAAGGTGYVTEAGVEGCGKEHCGAYLEQSEAITDEPDIIVVAGGRNDPAESIEAAALKLFTSLRDAHPDATVIALSPWADDDPLNEAFTAKSAAVQKAAAGADVIYVDTGQPFVGHADLISSDGVHPNAAGYTKLSLLLAPMLAEATGHSPTGVGSPSATSATERQDQVREALRAKEWPELTPAVDELGDDARVPEWVTDHCLDVDDSNADGCAYGDEGAELIALLGDSHAISYMPTLREAFPDQRIQSLTLQQCPAAPVAVQVRTSQGSSPYPECDDHRAWTMKWIGTHKPQTVVIVDTWDTPTRMPGEDTVDKLREYKSALTDLVGRLTEMGSQVVVLASPPPGENLVDCKTPASTPGDCLRTMPRSYSEWTKATEDAVAESDAADAHFVRTDAWFCATGSCPAFVAGVATFADGNHLTDAAARALGPLLVQALSTQ